MTVQIARAGKQDAKEFYELEAKCFEMDYNDKDTMYYWMPILDHMLCYKAVDLGRIVGGIVSMPTYDRRWYINSLFVDPAYRRRRIGIRLVDKVLKNAWPECIITLEIKTDRPHLLELYGRLGFAQVDVAHNYYLDGSSRFVMQRGGLFDGKGNM